MNWRELAIVIRHYYIGKDTVRFERLRRAEAENEVTRTVEDGFRVLLIERSVALIAAYHEAGETDEAFEVFGRRVDTLAVAMARLMEDGDAIDELILEPVRSKVELMFDQGTAERLMAAFERNFRRTGQPGF